MNEALQAPVDTNNYKLDDKLSGPHKLIMQCWDKEQNLIDTFIQKARQIAVIGS